MSILLNTFWFIWILKYILFWLYLWQLKEYHVGRFVDHFRTDKGKRLVLDLFQLAKLFVFALAMLISQYFLSLFSVVVLIYVAQSALFVKGIITNSVKKPIITLKTIFLAGISLFVAAFYFWWTLRLSDRAQLISVLGFDLLTPIIVSGIVLIFQPLFVFARNQKLQKAKMVLEKIRATSNLRVIAVTGSYGKTSTKEFLTTILSKKFKVLSTTDHQNSEIGISNCILSELQSSHQIFIAEVGAYNKGKVKEVCSVIKPTMGIVTGVNEQHLSLFGSMENLISAEGGGELADALTNDGTLFVNGDNKYCLNVCKKFDGSKKIYSLSNKKIDADIWSEDITVAKDSISFLAVDKTRHTMHFMVKVLGKQNVQNLLGAILVARNLGMEMGEIAEACGAIRQAQAGMTLSEGKLGLTVVDSSYSANPDGVFADLDYFSILPGKKVVVMPCLIELGGVSAQIHEKIGRRIGEVCDFAIITSNDRFREIKKGFDQTRKEQEVLPRCILCENPEDIYSEITLFCKAGDAVLLEGRVPSGLLKLIK